MYIIYNISIQIHDSPLVLEKKKCMFELHFSLIGQKILVNLVEVMLFIQLTMTTS